jgi:hypothetical protein
VNNNAVIDFKGFKAFYESLMNQQAVSTFYDIANSRSIEFLSQESNGPAIPVQLSNQLSYRVQLSSFYMLTH